MATEFDQLLASINLTDDESEAIEIRADRTFVLPEGYNTTIAYEGDVNSQIVRFKIPNKHEGYSLSACANKKLTWYNKDTKASGVSDLKQEDMDLLVWYVPAEVLAKAGTLDISISLYSIDASGKVTFAWNTGTFSQLKIASTMDTINSYPFAEDLRIPNKDEILFINLEGRNIVAPKGFNTTVANFHEIGLASVYFQMNSQYKDWVLTPDSITIEILSIIGENKVVTGITNEEIFFAPGTPGDSMLCFKWDIPPAITTGSTGAFTIAIVVKSTDGTKIWRSSPYRDLMVGETETFDDYNVISGELTEYVG
jgi:hypothetical protein